MSVDPRPIKRVLLVYPFSVIDSMNIYGVAHDRDGNVVKGDKVEPSLGLAYISAYLAETLPEIEVELLDANAMAIKDCVNRNAVNIPQLWDQVEQSIRQFQPDLVGISCFSLVTAASTKTLATLVKEIDSSIRVVIGGNYANTSYDEALSRNSPIDIVGFSEGEPVLHDLILALNEGRGLETVPGIAFRNEDDRIQRIANRETMLELDRIPECDRASVDMEFYCRQGNYFIYRFLDRETTRVAPMLASRGCQFKCSFCTARLIWGGEIRYRKPELVVDEMLRLEDRYEINTFTFFDANIVGKRRHFMKLADEIIRRIPGITWNSIEGMQVSSLNDEVVEAVCASGCKWFVLPFESSNPKTIKSIGKAHTLEMVSNAIESIRRIDDTWISGNVITGFPFEKKDDIEHSLDYALGLDLDWLYVYRFIPFPGIQMYQECLDAGFTKKYAWDTAYIDDLFVLNTPEFEAGYVAERNYECNARFNFFENRNIQLRPEQAIRDFDYVLERSIDNPLALYGKACAYERLGNDDEARRWLKRTLGVLEKAESESKEGNSYQANSMESISKSFVVIAGEIDYAKYFRQAGVDVRERLEGLQNRCPVS